METPGKRLKAARIRAKFESGSEAARALKIPPTTYENYENDDRRFDKHAPKFATFFGVNLTWLMTGSGPMILDETIQLLEELPGDAQDQVVEYIHMLHAKHVPKLTK